MNGCFGHEEGRKGGRVGEDTMTQKSEGGFVCVERLDGVRENSANWQRQGRSWEETKPRSGRIRAILPFWGGKDLKEVERTWVMIVVWDATL